MNPGSPRRSLAEHIGRAQMLVYAAAVALATLGASVVGFHFLHQHSLRHLESLAKITALESQPALVFGDDAAGSEVLHGIPAEEGVTRAELFDAKGTLRASAAAPQSGFVGALARALGDDEVAAPVNADGHRIGEVRLAGGREPMLQAFFGLILADVLVLTFVGVLSLVTSRRNTQRIAEPLTQLRTLMQQAMQHRDFTHRAPAADIAEVDDLRMGFNALLDEVVRRDQALRANNQVLRRLAFHDTLTGLPNRAMFESALTATLNECAATRARAALFYLDLDGFKPVNDTYGHDAGDRLLAVTAARLRNALPDGALPARVGGDEFVALISPPPSEVGPLIERLRSELTKPLAIDRHVIRPGVSIGAALYPDDGIDAEALLQAADKSMYRMKELHYRDDAARQTAPAGAEAIASGRTAD
ncbi:MAG TPA: diguanylate cyclase [Rudaea sp.]|nr:diguanylate cyclase [Rudaea sp.]